MNNGGDLIEGLLVSNPLRLEGDVGFVPEHLVAGEVSNPLRLEGDILLTVIAYIARSRF